MNKHGTNAMVSKTRNGAKPAVKESMGRWTDEMIKESYGTPMPATDVGARHGVPPSLQRDLEQILREHAANHRRLLSMLKQLKRL